MNADHWRRIKALFHAALERPPEERAAFLTDACGGDAASVEVRAEVERLLASHAAAGSFIEQSPVIGAGDLSSGAPHPSMTGRIIGRYEVGELVGAGGMGEVYVARDLELGRKVAVKIAIGSDPEAHARLRREAQHASQLNHPNICTIHEVGMHDGVPFIVMEYVEGQRLSERVPPDGLTSDDVLRYGMQIADALRHAHRAGVTHRDLKSANIVLTPEGRAKVLDFGLARRVSTPNLTQLSISERSLTAEGHIAGTLSCMAPELLRGQAADARSDIWSLGILLYEMATGAKPFDGATGFELSGAILYETPAPLPPDMPIALQSVILRCLEKHPQDRYHDAAEAYAALEAAIPGAVAPRSRRALIGALTTLIIAGVVAAWHFNRAASPPVGAAVAPQPVLAVMDFDNMSGAEETAWLSRGVPTMLMTGFAQTRGLEVISAQRLHDAVKQIGATGLGSIEKGQAADVARRAGASAVVTGSIATAGHNLRIDAQVEDLASGRVLVAESVRGTDLFTLVDQLTAQIKNGVGIRDRNDVRPVAELSSPSLEAYKYYSQALDAYLNVRFEDAATLLNKAVAIDPTFAEAHLQLALLHRSGNEPTRRREALRNAAEHVDRLSEPHRRLLDVEMARDSGDPAKASRALEDLIARFPTVEEAYAIAHQLYPADQASKTLAAGVAALPASALVRNHYGYALIETGRYGEALREFETAARLRPREPNPYDSIGELHLLLGAPEKAIDAYSRALTIDPTWTYAHNGKAWALAVMGRYEEALAEEPTRWHVLAFLLSRVGRYREASKAIDEGIREALGVEDFARGSFLRLLAAALAIERHHYTQALRDCGLSQQLIARSPGTIKPTGPRVLMHLVCGMASLGLGRIEDARRHLQAQNQIETNGIPAGFWWRKSLEGEVALARGDLERAVASFSAGTPSRRMAGVLSGAGPMLANNLLSQDALARAARARGDTQAAIRIYRELLDWQANHNWVTVFEPRYVLEIARLLDHIGDRSAALVEYERFLNAWRRADGGLPEVLEARRAVTRLRQSR